jgi:hypothetical protein
MDAHDLAKRLLDGPNLPIELNVFGHSYSSLNHADSHGKLRVAKHRNNYGVEHVCIYQGDYPKE